MARFHDLQERLGKRNPLVYPKGNLDYQIAEKLKATAKEAKRMAAHALTVAASPSAAPSGLPTTSVYKARWYGWDEDQGPTPRCTGYATVVAWLHQKRRRLGKDGSVTVTTAEGQAIRYASLDALADAVYQRARTFDQSQGWNFSGGATMWGAGMAARALGLCKEFRWGQTVEDGINALLNGYVPTLGIDWTEGLDDPIVTPVAGSKIAYARGAGQSLGGHDIAWTGADIDDGFVRLNQTWGRAFYGVDGLARVPVRDVQQMLAAGGELCIFID